MLKRRGSYFMVDDRMSRHIVCMVGPLASMVPGRSAACRRIASSRLRNAILLLGDASDRPFGLRASEWSAAIAVHRPPLNPWEKSIRLVKLGHNDMSVYVEKQVEKQVEKTNDNLSTKSRNIQGDPTH